MVDSRMLAYPYKTGSHGRHMELSVVVAHIGEENAEMNTYLVKGIVRGPGMDQVSNDRGFVSRMFGLAEMTASQWPADDPAHFRLLSEIPADQLDAYRILVPGERVCDAKEVFGPWVKANAPKGLDNQIRVLEYWSKPDPTAAEGSAARGVLQSFFFALRIADRVDFIERLKAENARMAEASAE